VKLQRGRHGLGFAAPPIAGGVATLAHDRIGAIERLPKSLLCVPLVLQWLYLAARYRSLTLPSVVNPGIETGGLVGESKAACLDAISAEFAPFVAATLRVRPGQDGVAIRRAAGQDYPLIVKPDIGWCGYGVRRVNDDDELRRYATEFPGDATFLLQDFVAGPGEAGIFYRRAPSAPSGSIVGMAIRHQPCVTGDGKTRLRDLIASDARLAHQSHAYQLALGEVAFSRIPALGETITLTTVASLRVGGRYELAMRLRTDRLEQRIDAIARSMPEFHFGRFDVRFGTEDELRLGEFRIIEVNGAGSEAIEYWDPSLGLIEAYRGVFRKQEMLFELASEFRRAGHVPIGIMPLARAWQAQLRLMRRYPPSN